MCTNGATLDHPIAGFVPDLRGAPYLHLASAMSIAAISSMGAGPLAQYDDVLAALRRHRHALRVGDGAGVDRTLDHEARRPNERDLLIDLAAAEGVDSAARKLARFWRSAETQVQAVRVIAEREVEVYERVRLPDRHGDVDVATLLRRGRDGTWRVVVAQRAPSDGLSVRLPAPSARLDDAEVTRALLGRWGCRTELIVSGEDGVLREPERGWLAHVQRIDGGYEVTLEPAEDEDARHAQLVWLARSVAVLGHHLGARRLWVPAARKVVGVEAFEAIGAAAAPSSKSLLLVWTALHRDAPLLYTAGLSAFALPELVTDLTAWNDERTARRLLSATALAAAGGGQTLRVGYGYAVGTRRVVLAAGPRGPAAGRSFGRRGALAIRPLRAATVTRSGVVERVGKTTPRSPLSTPAPAAPPRTPWRL